MEKCRDAYGQAILAYYNGEHSFEIIEKDDGYFDVSSGAKTYFSEYTDWPQHEKTAMKLVRGRVLDIGCGAGRHSLYLQKRRFDVMGIDNSPLAVKVCKARGVKKVKNMSIADIGKFKPHSFDTVIMLGNNFGLFGGMERGRKLLRKLYRITSPGARIIAESTNPYKTKNQDYLWYHKFNRKRGRMGGQLRFRLLFKKCVGEWFDYLLVSKDEMKEILKSTGWKAGKFIDSSGPSYIAVIRKNQ